MATALRWSDKSTNFSGGLNNSLFVVKLAPNVKRIGDEPQTVILRIYRNVTCEGELIQTAISLALAERLLSWKLLFFSSHHES